MIVTEQETLSRTVAPLYLLFSYAWKKISDEKIKKPTSLSSPPGPFSRPPITLPTAAPTTTTTDAPPRVPPPTESSRRDLLAKLAERRRTAAQEARAERPLAPEATPTSPARSFEYVD